MIIVWSLLLIWNLQPTCSEHLARLDPSSANTSDFLMNLMEKTYSKFARSRTVGGPRSSSEAGSPLLLTPYIEGGKLKEAREAAYVDPAYLLPNMTSYSGYLTVNKKYNANLWFWYFPVSGKSVEDTPWMIWLQGGPGASSLYGLFKEIGPFYIGEDNNIEEMRYSWGKNHSLLFIDNPVGTGFSFTDDDRGYATNQTAIGENLYTALQQFLTIFPELRKAPLTIAGESYAGKHIPSLGIQIHWHKHEDEPINLQGLAIGNGFIDPLSLLRHSYFVREVGLVDDRVSDLIKRWEVKIAKLIENRQMEDAFTTYSILLDVVKNKAHLTNMYNYLRDDIYIGGRYLDYIQRADVRRALHVGNTEFGPIFAVYLILKPDIMSSAKIWLEELLDNYKVMLYNGHLDVLVPYHPSVNTYRSLNFSGSSEFEDAYRGGWYHGGKLSGYYRIAGNLTEVMVRGSGHMVPADQPGPALGLISAFVRGIDLDEDSGSLVEVEKSSLRRRQLPLEQSASPFYLV